jgi:hypothetical protein
MKRLFTLFHRWVWGGCARRWQQKKLTRLEALRLIVQQPMTKRVHLRKVIWLRPVERRLKRLKAKRSA